MRFPILTLAASLACAQASTAAAPSVTVVAHSPTGTTIQTGTITGLHYVGWHLALDFTPTVDKLFANGFDR